jgi:hypothetical protein
MNTANSSARDLYLRNLCLHQRVHVVHTHLLSKLWYWHKFAHPCSICKADNHCDIVVRMERRDIRSPCVSSLSERNGRQLKPGGPTSEMHAAIPCTHSPASGNLRNYNGGMARHLEELRPKGQPTTMALSPLGAMLLACLLPGMDMHRMVECRRIVSRTETPYLLIS